MLSKQEHDQILVAIDTALANINLNIDYIVQGKYFKNSIKETKSLNYDILGDLMCEIDRITSY